LNYIYIDGPPDTLRGLVDVPDMILRLKGPESLEDGNIRVSAYATDEAITEVQNRGATVTVVFNNDEMAARTNELFSGDNGTSVT
jgi:hypothetical protein